MKYFYVLFISFFFVFQISNAQKQIPNNDFEDWINSNKAAGWTCSITANKTTFVTAEKSPDSYSGTKAVKLETKDIFGYQIPGMIQLGFFNYDTKENKGGIPFSSKPTAFEVHLKYDHQNSTDSLLVYCLLSKYDRTSHQTIKISESWYTHNSNIQNYETFVFPIYYKTDDIPDTINIGFSSSGAQLHIGSTLYVDDLKLLYGNYYLPPTVDFPINANDSSFDATWQGPDYINDYLLDVATDKEFTNHLPGFVDKNVGDTTIFHVAIPDTSVKKVYYRVKANYDSITSNYSETMEITIPYIPVFYKPEIITSKYFVAKWKKIPSALYYIFSVAKDSIFSNYVDGYYYLKTDSNIISVVGLEKDTKYYFRVKAGYLGLKSEYSTILNITTPVSDYGDLIQFFTLPDRLVIFADETVYNSIFYLYDINGKVFWQGKLENRYTEIPLKTIKILIFVAETPQGIIRKKIGISDMGNY